MQNAPMKNLKMGHWKTEIIKALCVTPIFLRTFSFTVIVYFGQRHLKLLP